jgi:hypothetical protein
MGILIPLMPAAVPSILCIMGWHCNSGPTYVTIYGHLPTPRHSLPVPPERADLIASRTISPKFQDCLTSGGAIHYERQGTHAPCPDHFCSLVQPIFLTCRVHDSRLSLVESVPSLPPPFESDKSTSTRALRVLHACQRLQWRLQETYVGSVSSVSVKPRDAGAGRAKVGG